MSVYIDCLNKFFKENKISKKLTSSQLIKLSKTKLVGVFNILGFIQNKTYIWSWTSPVDGAFDAINEGLAYKYLHYGLTIFRNNKMMESDYFKLYIRYILTKSNIKFNNNFDIIIFLIILNYIKNKKNNIIILKYNKNNKKQKKNNKKTEGWKNIDLVQISHIDYSDINLDDDKCYYIIYEIPKKDLDIN